MEFGYEVSDAKFQVPNEIAEISNAGEQIAEEADADANLQISEPDASRNLSKQVAQQDEVARPEPGISHSDPAISHSDPEISHSDSEISHSDSEISHSDPEISHSDSEISHLKSEIRHSASEPPADAPPVLPPAISGAHLMREVPVEALSANIRPLGQLEDSYIIATDEEGLLLIDQHIAHERILFNRYRRREDSRPPESQRLLLPETFDLTPAQAVVFGSVEAELEKCGFELMRLSGRTVAIKAAPADLPAREARTLLAEILDTIERERRSSAQQDWRDHIAAQLACRAAVKAHTKLAPEKLRWLIDNLLQTDSPVTGPHGRPGILRLTMRDIEKGLQRS
jgi:DNA mismatch repair protein MutL